MRWFANIAYLCVILLASPVLVYQAWRQQKYREGWSQKFLGRAPRLRPKQGRRIWLHAVSMGEVHVLVPLVRAIMQRDPHCECVISTTTKTGFEAAARKFPDATRFYCPLDFSWAVDEAMRRIQPDWLVLSELEIWPNLVASAKRHGARVAVANGRLSEKSFRGYRRIGWLLGRTIRRLDLVAVQAESYAQRFAELGVPQERITVTGSIKFDGAITDRRNEETQRLRGLSQTPDEAVVFLAGSTQAPEEQLAIDAFKSLAAEFPQLRLMIAPRHPERFHEVDALLRRSGLRYGARSRIAEAASTSRVLLLDSMGELQAWWGMADIAYVGGSMGNRQGQNMIEPSGFGAAVSFGPKTKNFRDVVALLREQEAAEVVHDGADLELFIRRCLEDAEYRTRLGRNAQDVVRAQIGAAERTVALLWGDEATVARREAA